MSKLKAALGLLTFIVATSAGAQDYDSIGTVSTFRPPSKEGSQYVRVKSNAGFYPNTPARKEYYPPSNRADTLAVTVTYDQPGDGATIAGGPLYSPTERMLGIPEIHAQGNHGEGIGIMLIDFGYSNAAPHPAIGTIAGSRSAAGDTIVGTYGHTTQALSLMAAKPGSSKFIGGAYGASYYVATLVNVATELEYAKAHNCIITVLPQHLGYEVDTSIKRAIKAYQDWGGCFIVSPGNGGSVDVMQGLCGLPDVICPGATIGGGALQFTSTFYSGKVLPIRQGQRLDFALPNFEISAAWQYLDGSGIAVPATGTYAYFSGTSATGPILAYCYALTKKRYPEFSWRMITQMITNNCSTFDALGVRGYVPNMRFLLAP